MIHNDVECYNEDMIDYDELEKALKKMKPRQRLYEIVKTEMIKRDRWKTQERGISFRKGDDERRAKLKPTE